MDSFITADRWWLARGESETDCIEGFRHDSVKRPTSSEEGKGVWVLLAYVSCGDYNPNGSVGRSNVRVFEEEHAGLFTSDPADAVMVSSGYGYRGVAVRWEAYDHKERGHDAIVADEETLTAEECARLERWDALSQTLASIVDYPIINDDDHSALECEEEDEAWSDYGRSDFRRELTEAFPDHEEAIDGASDESIDALWYAACEACGRYAEHESDGVSFPFRDALRHIDASEVATLTA